jgi:hypothetical protein
VVCYPIDLTVAKQEITRVLFKPMEAGMKRLILIMVFTDLLIGEVFVCCGQSLHAVLVTPSSSPQAVPVASTTSRGLAGGVVATTRGVPAPRSLVTMSNLVPGTIIGTNGAVLGANVLVFGTNRAILASNLASILISPAAPGPQGGGTTVGQQGITAIGEQGGTAVVLPPNTVVQVTSFGGQFTVAFTGTPLGGGLFFSTNSGLGIVTSTFGP